MSDQEQEQYDASYDFESEFNGALVKQFDATAIDYSTAEPDDIEDPMEALEVLKYLKTIDKSTTEEMYYMFVMDKFDIEEEDPTVLTREEKIFVASSFKTFVRYMFLVEYGFKFKCNWHHDFICDTLENLFLGKTDCPRIVLNIPPRYSKTQLLIYFVAWTMGHTPDSEYIMIGYSKMLAEDSSFKIRECILNDKYQSIFPVTLFLKPRGTRLTAGSRILCCHDGIVWSLLRSLTSSRECTSLIFQDTCYLRKISH
jgi:hypothetical protein